MTNVVLVTSTELTRTKNPALPSAPVEYDRAYQDTAYNILRQYFNQLDNFVGQFSLGAVYVVADLPDAVTAGVGSRAFVIDAAVLTFNTTVTGGGSGKVHVFSDGTVWKVG